MEKDLIIKALECLTGEEVMFCRECGYNKVGAFSCRKELAKDALALIKQLTEEVAGLKAISEQYQKQFEDCYEEKAKLTEENERLNAPTYRLREDGGVELMPTIKSIRADTVREVQEKIRDRCLKGGIYPAFVARTIDQIAKEMLEGNQ